MKLLYIVSCIFDAFVIFLFFENFFENRKANIEKWMISLGLFAQQMISTVILHNTQSVYLRLFIQVVGLLLLSLFYQGSILRHILGMTIFVGFSIIAEGIAEVSASIMNIEQKQEEVIILLFLVEIFMFILVLIARVFTQKSEDIPVRYQLGYLLVPLLSIVVINGMISQKPTLSWLIGLFSILVINMVAFYLLNALTRFIMEKNRKQQMEHQIQIQKEKYKQLSESFIQGNRLIHDVNKHHRILKGYLLASKQQEALNYIDKIDSSFRNLYSSVNTGNIVIDSILGRFKEQLENANCNQTITINIDKNRRLIEDYDLVVILGNITDNILEAINLSEVSESKIPNVEVKIETTKTAFILYTKNTVFEKKRKKKDKWFHGLGLHNVTETVEKYGGSVIINAEKDSFETMIQVPLQGEQLC